jgi:hypothetical protein
LSRVRFAPGAPLLFNHTLREVNFPATHPDRARQFFSPRARIKFDSRVPTLIFKRPMAEIPPNNPLPGAPTGAEPLKKSTGKVQPKKETVRINLPPKPTAAPTIKLPTLPPGGPTGAPSPAFTPAPVAAAPVLNRTAAPVAAAAPTKTGAAPVAAQRPAVAQRPVAPLVPSIKPLDRILIYTTAVTSIIAVDAVGYLYYTLNNLVTTFTS